MEAFAGIDVAFAKGKRLPVCVCCWINSRLVPLLLRKAKTSPPRGQGNAATLINENVLAFAEATSSYLRAVESEFNVRICRIAIDAPSDPRDQAYLTADPNKLWTPAASVALPHPAPMSSIGSNRRRPHIWLRAVWHPASPTLINSGCWSALHFLPG